MLEIKKLFQIAFAFCLLGNCLEPAVAQPAKRYRVLDLNSPAFSVSMKDWGAARNFVKDKLQSGEDGGGQAAMKKVIRHEIAKLTQPSSEVDYERTRTSLINSYVIPCKTPEKRAFLIKEIASVAGIIAAGKDYSPQARINALAILVHLDEQAAGEGTPYPKPYQKNLSPLLAIAKGEQYPEYLRAIALYGLQRQLGVWWNERGWGRSKNARNAILPPLTKIIQSKVGPEAGLERLQSNAWLRRRAFDCLAVISSPVAADEAITCLGDKNELPSVRLTCCEYLSHLDQTQLSEEQRAKYVVGLAHFVRSQLVDWYNAEDNRLKAKSGATAGGYGGMGGYGGGGYGGYGGGPGMGGPGMGGPGMGGPGMGGYGGGDEGEGGYGGYGGMGGYGGGQRGSGGNRGPSPEETQTWQTRIARRLVNQVTQAAHIALDGKPLAEEREKSKDVNRIVPALAGDLQAKAIELVEAIDTFQTAVNDRNLVTDINSLLTQAEVPIEEIMDLVLEIPGFTDAYPELADDEGLETVPETPADQPPADGEASGDAPGAPAAAGGEGDLSGNAGGGPSDPSANGN